ncbi:hypothetical protein JIM95_001515 [Corynebacterium sp. CCM 8835]|uniref:hypothetical protein n=1 Tax=Corynebacterium antarcticum TaxID=2800405 RepID=UPI002004DF09|nr:hypothetical protein [Corynebacterium antarcticum]MCK7641603.1 hypothetical protein [Corynebacterium antarcticum]MCK7660299.1 hypothetical protein [Corynebacterium antarcticum]MCL0244831.1 hypothetical protein [Corynebacterium antarcticum]MCX7539613.1 hypothetical protein [Corynebacterium antarcticum]
MTETAASGPGNPTSPVIVVPASPALVLSGDADPAGVRLRTAAERILSRHGDLPVHLVGSRDPRWWTSHRGSFAAWGDATVNVGEGNHLAELVQRFLLGPDNRERVVDVRGELGHPDAGVLTVVAVDGSAGLTERAPLALIDGAESVDAWCRALLAGGPPAAMTSDELREAGIIEPDLWIELADARPVRAELVAADTTTGVGRYVAEWGIGA